MAFSPLKSHPASGDTSWDDDIGIPRPEVAIILSVNIKNAEELDFNAINVFALFKKKCKFHMCLGIVSNIL